jgi:mevalonate kinase
MSNNTNSEKESLSRIREILFGDQIASLENKVDQLAEKQKEDMAKLLQELNTVVEDAESLINDKTEALKEELMRNIKAVETAGVMKKELADILRNVADLLDQDSQE